MEITRRFRPFHCGLLVVPLALASFSTAGASSVNLKLLLAQANKNNNSVRTLVYTTKLDIISRYRTIHTTMRGEEDEIANREQDHESASVLSTAKTGQKRSIKYTIDVVFISGRTYYRSSLAKNNVWQEKPGMSTIQDPILQSAAWKRGRTRISFLSPSKYTIVSQGPTVHLRAHLTRGTASADDDLYITNGSTPYLVREVLKVTAIVQGQTVTQRTDTRYGPFNQTLNIGVPSTGA
ncbi:MAG: hypothetical protein NVS2B16_02640 [Chloroflexota bacterium]